MRRKTKIWLDGFINGTITGGVTSILTALGVVAAEATGAKVNALDIKQLFSVFISGIIVHACFYIKQNQLPPIFNNEDTVTDLRKEDLPKEKE